MILRRFKKSKSLRIANWIGLSVVFSGILLSVAYIKKEVSYDRFHEKADRIVRYSIQYNNEPIDVRIPGFTGNHPSIADVSGIEAIVRMHKVNKSELLYNGRINLLNDLYFVSSNFFEVFDFKLLEGDKKDVLDAPEKAVISKSYARHLFGDESPIGKELQFINNFRINDKKIFISGVFEDFPETSHFHSDFLIHYPDSENGIFSYVYLLLHPEIDLNTVNQAIASNLNSLHKDDIRKPMPLLFPLTDIHLYSNLQREHEHNGHIYFVYLVIGANLLLLLIVLFNLWLNAGLIFSLNRRYYQLLRLNGASSLTVLQDEMLLAFILGCFSILMGSGIGWFLSKVLQWKLDLETNTILTVCITFLFLVIIVSIIPVIRRITSTLFYSSKNHLPNQGFTLSGVKYMLIGQYGIVMFIITVSICISKQLSLIRSSQIGGENHTILVLDEQPYAVLERYELLIAELMKYPEIQMVTSAMQLPSSAIRDRLFVWKENESKESSIPVPLLVVGNDFLRFFDIQLLTGRDFLQNNRSFEKETEMMMQFLRGEGAQNITEEYIINLKAAKLLGFNAPEEAIGKHLYVSQSTLDYINNGIIIGVTENFNYTNTFEDNIPQILLQRKVFQSCFMVSLSQKKVEHALQIFNRIWNEVNPEYQLQYSFLHDVYNNIYHNEINAEQLVHLFSLLCLVISTLGLIIIMAFVVKRKTKEIGVRKVNGATATDIVKMLNSRLISWIIIAFILSVPGSYLAMTYWLRNFAYKTTLDWWIFILAGSSVMLLSVLAISWQSWRATTINPVTSLKSE